MKRYSTDQRQLARRIRWEQQRRGWTNADLALALRDRGCAVDVTALSKVKSGKRAVSLEEAVALADLFETTVDGLLKDVEWALSAELNAVLDELDQRRREVLAVTAQTVKTVRRAVALAFEGDQYKPRLIDASARQENAMLHLIDILLEAEARIRGEDPSTYPDSAELLFDD